MQKIEWASYLIGRATAPVRMALLAAAFPRWNMLRPEEWNGTRFSPMLVAEKGGAQHTAVFLLAVNPDGSLTARLVLDRDAVALLDPGEVPLEGWEGRALRAELDVDDLSTELVRAGVPMSYIDAQILSSGHEARQDVLAKAGSVEDKPAGFQKQFEATRDAFLASNQGDGDCDTIEDLRASAEASRARIRADACVAKDAINAAQEDAIDAIDVALEEAEQLAAKASEGGEQG